jgi:GNAT superfamily N-acetyltransferase
MSKIKLKRVRADDHFDYYGWWALVAMTCREFAFQFFNNIENLHWNFGKLDSKIFEYYTIHNEHDVEVGRFIIRDLGDKTYNIGSLVIYPNHQKNGYATAVYEELVEVGKKLGRKYITETNSIFIIKIMERLRWKPTHMLPDDMSVATVLFRYESC